MAQAKNIETEINPKLAELYKNRQLFLLNSYTKQLKLNHDITSWEEVTCTGYNPYYQRLEAIVQVKETGGYNGGLCTHGSMEWVRFFVDFKDGHGFQDMGYTGFKVADISSAPPGPQHPLSYVAFLFMDDQKHRKFLDCDHAVIPTMRAVLSWNSIPNGNPNQHPHYGNHLDADIQLARRPFIIWKEFAEVNKLTKLATLVDPEFKLLLKEPVTEQADVILKSALAADVSPHRTLYATLGSKINSKIDFSSASGIFDISNLDNLKVDLNAFYDFFNGAGKNADVSYEELDCVGLNTASDRLSAVIHVKRSSGFSGNLCTKGSNEHVAFWADWNNNGTFDQYLGTTSLVVHDIANIPKGGLYYTVQLPINVKERLRLCSSPNIIRIRAVLSWESLPSTTNPNILNHWGNYRDALVQLRPAFRPGSGIHSAIYLVGLADRFLISPVSHLYNAGVASISTNRPWGGWISFNGIIDRNGFMGAVKYKFLWKKQGAPDADYLPTSAAEDFKIDYIYDAAPWYYVHQVADAAGWYNYLQNPNTGYYITDNYLAGWDAGAQADGAYTIRFMHTDEFGNEVIGDEFTIMVCNTIMTVSTTANTVVDPTKDLDLVIDGGDCHSYTPGAPKIDGHLKVIHPYFGEWTLELQPTSHTHGVVPVPSSRNVLAIGDTGDANAHWTLDTAPLDPCGYTVSLLGYSRVILNSQPGVSPQYGPKAVGFAKLP